jgi:MinD-like ATPase involved in chromosome partitioning or flagellar assembly
VIKRIYLDNPDVNVGIVVNNSDSMHEIDAVYNKISHVVKKFLDKELYKYGFLFKIKQGVESKNVVGYSFDSDQNDCISNIAEILVNKLYRSESENDGVQFLKK